MPWPRLPMLCAIAALALLPVSGGLIGPVEPALAAGGAAAGSRDDNTTKRPRDQAHLIGGDTIMLETMWIPVPTGQGTFQAVGLTPYLEIHPEQVNKACYRTPWVAEALIIHLYNHPSQRQALADITQGKNKQEILALTELIAGPGVFKDVRLEQGLPLKQSRENETLSLVCK
ncbi:MAG: hypothetical protein ACPGOY_16960 [Rhodospirillaceae bacterium]